MHVGTQSELHSCLCQALETTVTKRGTQSKRATEAADKKRKDEAAKAQKAAEATKASSMPLATGRSKAILAHGWPVAKSFASQDFNS
eukprot:3563183-Alexandrium_andersonii.AAC.1